MIIIVLALSFILEVWFAFQPSIIWWDSAMYIGIGKMIYSLGTIGVFEPIRPILLPLILGGVWKIGINPIIVGKLIAIASSIGTLTLVYLIGERLYKHAGLYAATLLSFTAVFFAFTSAPLTDIPSTFLGLLAIYFFIQKKYVTSGIIAATAFLMRFPQGIIFAALMLSIALIPTKTWKDKLQPLLSIILGFFILALPYFLSNIFFYHDPLLPLKLGKESAQSTLGLYSFSHYLYYIQGIFEENPFILFAIVALFPFIKKDRLKSSILIPIVSAGILLCAYFSVTFHQEIRYSIPFLPFLMILAGFGIALLTSKISFKYSHIVYTSVITLILIRICFIAYEIYKPIYSLAPEQYSFYTYFKDKGNATLLTTAPQAVMYSDVLVLEAMDTWEQGLAAYNREKTDLDYAAINECDPGCDTGEDQCMAAKKTLLNELQTEEKVFSATAHYCDLSIYKIRH